MTNKLHIVRNAKAEDFVPAGELMVNVYSQLDGFPKEDEQPAYYHLLRNVGDFTSKPDTELFVAVGPNGNVDGAVVFFGDMQYYNSGGTAPQEKNAAGFRLLAVNPDARGAGIGKLLTEHCISRAKELKLRQIIIHTTGAMTVAWKMYEKLGFKRSEDLDFMQEKLPVFGFRMIL
ncbi:MAG: GNAT family N-acetyltransferase [Bacteroidetes bacterium]|nr:MAG: GNAT family N-acetyltransferase [Bacteroidota bacterium]